MFRALATLGFLALAAVPQARAQPVRGEAEIRQSVLSNGARRYALAVQVGATTLLAALDTGSTGLRILPGALRAGDAAALGGPFDPDRRDGGRGARPRRGRGGRGR